MQTRPMCLLSRRIRASKLLSLAAIPEALALLLAIGFRPVVMRQADSGPVLFFVLEAGSAAVARAACAAHTLEVEASCARGAEAVRG